MFFFSKRCSLSFGIVLLLVAGPASGRLMAQPEAHPVLTGGASSQVATAGFYTLSWPPLSPGGTQSLFELAESTSLDFSDERVVYRGPDEATTVSGKPDGIYYYRIRTVSAVDEPVSSWSQPHEVSVQHHSLRRAFSFLGVGAFVFIATLVLIVQGHRRENLPPAS
jgi:hypothetical protein